MDFLFALINPLRGEIYSVDLRLEYSDLVRVSRVFLKNMEQILINTELSVEISKKTSYI